MRKPRLGDLFGPTKPKRRHFVTHDGTLIIQGESHPIAGERTRPHPPGARDVAWVGDPSWPMA